MKRIMSALLVVAATVSLLAVSPAEAKRMGGGSSLGMQRTAPASAPSNPSTAPQSAPAPSGAPAPAAPPASGMSRWLGPLAGLGIGAGLMALFGSGGMGSLLGMLALAAVAFFIVQLFRRKPPATQPRAMQFAAAAPGPLAVNPVADFPVIAGPVPTSANAPNYPVGFDAEEFVRQAKKSFIRLQAANDRMDLRDIRNFTTPELYAELAAQIQERDDTTQITDVVTLNAELLEATTEQERIIASVRYTGEIREEIGGNATSFSETWHVVKDLSHSSPSWYIAGIQQSN